MIARILVADDSESNRYVLSTWLRRAGYDVAEAVTGEEALYVAATQTLHLVILDVNLPDISGYEVCERIKLAEQTAAVPVLHVSATAVETADRAEGLRRGADGYLTEPVEREELLASVGALLRAASAQQTAVRLAGRLRRLNDATLAVNDALTLEQLVRTVVEEAAVLFDAAAYVAVVVDEQALRAESAPSDAATLEPCAPGAADELRRAAGEGTLERAIARGLLPQGATGRYLSAELSGGAGHRGVLLIEARESDDEAFADELNVVLAQYARAASVAIKNVRSYGIERNTALTLQRALLPDSAPSVPWLDLAVRYDASAEHAEVGGDFYEIFMLDDARVAFAVGDVVGHSLAAATVMAELRTGIRAYMLEGHGPSATLARLNAMLQRFHPDWTATVCCGVYERDGRCELANAGHLPGVIVRAGGVDFLPLGGPLLGLDAAAADAYTFELAPADALLFYTDGLVERRGEELTVGFERLAAAAAGARTRDLEELCDAVLREAGPEKRTDDIVLVAIRPR